LRPGEVVLVQHIQRYPLRVSGSRARRSAAARSTTPGWAMCSMRPQCRSESGGLR